MLTDITSPDAIRADCMAYGAGRLALEAGIVLTDTSSIDAIKADLILWAKQQAMAQVAADLGAQMSLQDGDGLRLVQLLASAGHVGVKPVELMKQANVALLGYAREEFARAIPLKKRRGVVSRKGRHRRNLGRLMETVRCMYLWGWCRTWGRLRGRLCRR